MRERMGRVEELLCQVDALRAAGKLPDGVTREERISFVYGNCKLANPAITREMVEAAVDGVPHLGESGLPPPPARTVSGKAFALAGPPFSEDVEVERGFVGVDGRPVLCIRPMTHGDARYAEGREAGRREGLLYAIEQLDIMAESQRGKVARLIVTSQGYQDSADRLRVRLRAGLAPFAPKAGEP